MTLDVRVTADAASDGCPRFVTEKSASDTGIKSSFVACESSELEPFPFSTFDEYGPN